MLAGCGPQVENAAPSFEFYWRLQHLRVATTVCQHAGLEHAAWKLKNCGIVAAAEMRFKSTFCQGYVINTPTCAKPESRRAVGFCHSFRGGVPLFFSFRFMGLLSHSNPPSRARKSCQAEVTNTCIVAEMEWARTSTGHPMRHCTPCLKAAPLQVFSAVT